MKKILDWLYFGGYRWYRKWRGGNWKYVGPKYQPDSCWIHNSNPFTHEAVWHEENY